MKVYLAGPYQWKDRISKCAEEARAAGIEITSGWLEEPHKPDTQLADLSEETHELYANRDLEDIDRAGVFVLFAVVLFVVAFVLCITSPPCGLLSTPPLWTFIYPLTGPS